MCTVGVLGNLKIYLDNAIKNFAGTWSYIIERKNVGSSAGRGEIISYNEKYVHKSASMIKVLILAYLCSSDIDLSKKIRIDTVERVEGGGALQEMNPDCTVSIEALAKLMIVLSDNLATNLLIAKLGRENIQKYAEDLNLVDTKLSRYMMDFVASSEGRENLMSVDDYNKLIWHIYDEQKTNPRFKLAWQILARQQFRDRIPYYWDEDIIFHHKTGMLDYVEHDGGIYEDGNFAYSIIIFTSNLSANAVGGRQIGELGKYILDYLKAEKS